MRFHLLFVQILLLLKHVIRLIEKQKFRLHIGIGRIGRSAVKCRIVIIRYTSQIRAHDFIKNVIAEIHNFLPASEILMQINALLPGFLCRKKRILSHKQFRTGQSEAVNALFDISNHKHVVTALFMSGDCRHNFFLYLVTVLILINHDFFKMSPEFLCRMPTLFCPIIHKNLQRKMLNIREIHNPLLSLGKSHLLRIGKRQANQFLCNRTKAHDLCIQSIGIHCKESGS